MSTSSMRIAPHSSRSLVLAWAALALTVLIWAGFFVSLRAGASVALGADELALLRFGPAGLVFLPLFWRRRKRLLALPVRQWLAIVAGAGLPYFLIAGTAMRHAPVSDGSTLIPGTLPLSLALLGWLAYGRRPVAGRWFAIALIATGAVGMVFYSGTAAGSWEGYALFGLGSLLWASYTLALQASGLDPLDSVALIAVVSLCLLLPWLLVHPPIGLLRLHAADYWLHGLVQGVGVGLISTLSYTFAISRLGAARATTAGALTPVVATLLGVACLREMPGPASLLGMAVIVAGVILAARVANQAALGQAALGVNRPSST